MKQSKLSHVTLFFSIQQNLELVSPQPLSPVAPFYTFAFTGKVTLVGQLEKKPITCTLEVSPVGQPFFSAWFFFKNRCISGVQIPVEILVKFHDFTTLMLFYQT